MRRRSDIIVRIADLVAWFSAGFLVAVIVRAVIGLELPPPYVVGIAAGVVLARLLGTHIGQSDWGRWE